MTPLSFVWCIQGFKILCIYYLFELHNSLLKQAILCGRNSFSGTMISLSLCLPWNSSAGGFCWKPLVELSFFPSLPPSHTKWPSTFNLTPERDRQNTTCLRGCSDWRWKSWLSRTIFPRCYSERPCFGDMSPIYSSFSSVIFIWYNC